MKAISIKQPWASLIIHGPKDIENRGQLWRFRGRVAVHASKRLDLAEYRAAEELIRERIILGATIDQAQCPLGAMIGTVEIVDCVTSSKSPWFVGPAGLVLRAPRALARPIPCRGQLGLWDVPVEIARLIAEAEEGGRW